MGKWNGKALLARPRQSNLSRTHRSKRCRHGKVDIAIAVLGHGNPNMPRSLGIGTRVQPKAPSLAGRDMTGILYVRSTVCNTIQ